MFKFLFKTFIFALVVGAFFYVWRLHEAGQLNEQGIKRQINALKEIDEEDLRQTLGDITDKAKAKSKEYYEKAKAIDWNAYYEKAKAINWSELRDKIGLSDQDMQDYKESLKFIFEESEPKIVSKDSVKNEEVESVADKQSEQAEKRVVVRKPKAVKSKPKIDESLPESYKTGMRLLDEAKAEGRKALPGMPNHIKHLRKSVKLYQQSQKHLEEALEDPGCPSRQKHKIKALLPKIQKQIFWGKRLDTI